jgi:YidC/Oxa1 family membrane protein insertase
MAIYKENNVNFLSGCLPLLIQLPIVMALYSGISGFAPLNYANFIWLPSLGLADPFYIMPILLAASTWLQQKVSTMPGQDQQSASFQIMFPAMMFLFGINFPSGISLYWFMFNLASIIHQMVYNKGAFGKFIPTGIIKPVSKGIKK